MNRVHLSVACSIDGYIDDTSNRRLVLSSEEDLRDVDRERANYDAILVGAQTLRADNPSLVLRDPVLLSERVRRGMHPQLTKVTVTASGDLDDQAHFFRQGDGEKIVLCPREGADAMERRLAGLARVIGLDGPITAMAIMDALEQAGVRSLFVEGGVHTLSMFLAGGPVDAFRLAIAPFFVAEPEAPRLQPLFGVGGIMQRRLAVSNVRLLGDTTVIDYMPR